MNHRTVISNPISEEESAIVYLDEYHIDPATKKQIKAMISNPSLSHSRVMPDCHVSHGGCVGFTSHVSYQRVVPSYVGGDIGCGILTYPLNKRRINLKRIDSIIRSTIPMGTGHYNIHPIPPVEESYISKYLSAAQHDADLFACRIGVPPITINYEYFSSLCEKIGIDLNVCLCSFGTLGSGNHFIEINRDPNSEEHFLTIHSGSRAFGMKLFEYHNSFVDRSCNCLVDEFAVAYCFDLICAQHLAIMNRHIMLQLILREIGVEYNRSDVIESIHNYIDFKRENIILRKGAISAEDGEMCIVALNMRDGILLCRGKGNPDWNFSCAHGCGRIMSRADARRKIKLKEFKKSMENVVSSCVRIETIDEAPSAYKDMHIIVSALDPTVHVETRLESVVNIKGFD